MTELDLAFTRDNTGNLAPGCYPSDPQGHTLLADEHRMLTVIDMGGVVSIGGIDVHDPDILDAFAERLTQLAARYRARRADCGSGQLLANHTSV